jgi:orotidine-5'-phosphate decarboxylase
MSSQNLNSHKVMVALDNMDRSTMEGFLASLPEECPWVKIGLEQYLSHGKEMVQFINERYNKEIFLDLKLHDIPNTVAKALKGLKDLPVRFVTVHLSGGKAMLEAVQDVRNEYLPNVNILGVSFLTSLDTTDLNQLFGIEETQIDQGFKRLFNLALETGTQGIVCSPFEIKTVKECEKSFGGSLIKVTPGIRFRDEIDGGKLGDQKRVLHPHEAFKEGSDYLVMGRSLTQAKDLGARIKELNS